jgi:1,4-alpha-glucan branching enzyme
MGDFNNWNKHEYPLKKLEFGKWELKLAPKSNGECRIDHLSKLKLVIKGRTGEVLDRLLMLILSSFKVDLLF